MKITVIGGGSLTWAFEFARDITGTFSAEETELCLMDINKEALGFVSQAVAKPIADRSSAIHLSTANDLAPALDGADMVLVSISVGGLAAMEMMTDPFCAHLDLGQAREMTQAMLEANRSYIRNSESLNF